MNGIEYWPLALLVGVLAVIGLVRHLRARREYAAWRATLPKTERYIDERTGQEMVRRTWDDE